jgi:DNA-binding response OmpR family regulator/predicted regulator of Ras-like GTPase activity (Roadblock/LC7/MglB family)
VPGVDRYDLVVATMAEQWRILVVEGEENLNWNIVNSLQKDGYIVRGVTGGAEAIRLLWSEEYDVVICSQQMPDADGFDLLQWMRTYCPGARMVMLAEHGREAARAQALEMGVAGYLEKPLDMHALKEELRRLLHQTGFSASLDSFDLLDVIQIITMSRKSIALVVSTGLEEQGILRFQNGELIWAEYGTLRGEEAFFALAAHKNGTVVHRPWNDQITPNVMQPLSRLIFQALQYRSKYAGYQQMSSELEAVKPGGPVPTSPNLPPLPPTTIPTALQGLDDDDRPFQFLAEDLPAERPGGINFEQMMRGGSGTGAVPDQASGAMGIVKNTEQNPDGRREWWEPTGSFPKLQKSGDAQEDGLEQMLSSGGINLTPSVVHKTPAAQGNPLPSWLTDQPTHLDLPVMRGDTGQMPVTMKGQSTALPAIQPSVLPANSQALPNLPRTAGAEWPAPPPNPLAGLNPAESGLRKIKPEEALFTGQQRAVKPLPSGPLRSAPVEWQTPKPGVPDNSGLLAAVNQPSRTPEPLQSLAALQRTNSAQLPDSHPPAAHNQNGPGNGAARPRQEGTDKPARRNYPALAAALQTLGYSVAGFVASAVVGLDGTPVAQVAVDELDISSMCVHFSSIVQGALSALEQGYWDHYEHTIITSNTQHILLRLIANQKDFFQVLITTRETSPANSLDVMVNIEAAISAALR